MIRTFLQRHTTCPDLSGNTDEQNTCDSDGYREHRMRKYNKEKDYNH